MAHPDYRDYGRDYPEHYTSGDERYRFTGYKDMEDRYGEEGAPNSYDDNEMVTQRGYGPEESQYGSPLLSWGEARPTIWGSHENYDIPPGYGESIPGASIINENPGFRGIGPKNYTRPDFRIQEDVCECLTDHSHIDASDVHVEVKNGVVTLTGSVRDSWMKLQAEDLVDRISGVREVRNDIKVERRHYSDLRASLPDERH